MAMKITKDELARRIEEKNLALVLNNVHCGKCGTTTIVDYEDQITVEPNGNTVLRGTCKTCGRNVARVIETGQRSVS